MPPAISILKPKNNSVLSVTALGDTGFPMMFETDGSASWFGYSLDGQKTVTVAGNTTLSGMSVGLHNVTVYANDTFGNMGESATVTFNVETLQEPFPTLLIVATSAGVATLAAVGVLIYFKKRSNVARK
jgi:hypothetical protein